MTIDGCDPNSWVKLPADYWWVGVCRHVNKEKTSCKVKAKKNAEGGETLASLTGCYVEIRAKIAKYAFSANGKEITGWTIKADSIKKAPIPAVTCHFAKQSSAYLK
jgi:hypothetical protein